MFIANRLAFECTCSFFRIINKTIKAKAASAAAARAVRREHEALGGGGTRSVDGAWLFAPSFLYSALEPAGLGSLAQSVLPPGADLTVSFAASLPMPRFSLSAASNLFLPSLQP